MTRSTDRGSSHRRLVFLCGLLPVLISAALPIFQPAVLSRVDRAVYDTLARSVPATPPSEDVVIVDVDERSLSTIGQWPWRRDVVALLIARLRDAGATVVALDIIFAEPDRDEDLGRPEDESTATRQPTPDEMLGKTIREGRVVLGYAMTFDPVARRQSPCVLHPVNLATFDARDEADEPPYFRATDAVCSLPIIAESSASSGFLNAAPDSDGILRRAPVVIELNGQVYPNLAFAAVAAATGTHESALRISNVNAASLIAGPLAVPLDGKGNMLLRYRGKKRTFPYVSAADALSGTAPARMLRDKIVFVGTTALGTREVVATPLDTLFAGVEVQATIADNLLQQDFFRRPASGTALEILAVLLLGGAVALFAATTGLLAGALAAAGGIATAWGGSIWLLSGVGAFLSPLLPTFAAIAVCGVSTSAKFTVERLRADRANREKSVAQRLMVQTLLSLTQARDAETGDHSRRTQQYAKVLAQELSRNASFNAYLTPHRIDLLSSLAPLHDIGKVGVPDHILNKPGPLTPDELTEMRKHPVIGLEVILKAEQQVGVRGDEILAMAKDIVYTHHERWDGTGYPRGLHGNEIPVGGRVMALVDVYDAAVTRTLYRSTLSHDEALAFIVRAKGMQFDPAVVEAFVRVADAFKNVSEAHHSRVTVA